MKNTSFLGFRFLRLVTVVCVLMGAGVFPVSAQTQLPQTAQDILNQLDTSPADDNYAVTAAYVAQFYPLWFTYNQSRFDNLLGTANTMVGPAQVSPIYHFVAAINYDTLYSSVYLNVSTEPVLITIPSTAETDVQYSVLLLDPYGTEFPSGIPPQTPGVYAYTGPDFTGTLPECVTRISLPLNYMNFFIRTVKYPNGQNGIAEAEKFRASLKTQTLSKYLKNPAGGSTTILPELIFAFSYKLSADNLIAERPITFLKQLQEAVAAPNTPPFSLPEQALSKRFNALFGDGESNQAEFSAGAQKAHELIVAAYLTQLGPTYWNHFTNIGNWGSNILDRAAITEYLQLSNGISTAAYYHTFSDGAGLPLDGSNEKTYVLRFRADQIPQAKRFWSVTAYTPHAIELVPNLASKYLVASYTPELHYETDGSVEIYMSARRPSGVPAANWLPIPPGKFNIVLRVYGPDGDVADNTYIPPAVEKR